MKKIYYSLLFLILGIGNVFAQKDTIFYNILSPSYSISYSKIKPDENTEFKSLSNGFSINLFRYGYRINNFEGSGGIGAHYISTQITENSKSVEMSYFGLAPEIRVKYFPLGVNQGLFFGTGGQFFVLPLTTSSSVKVNTFRSTFMCGLSKSYGFTLFVMPSMISGNVGTVEINKSWYFAMEIDIPWEKLINKFE